MASTSTPWMALCKMLFFAVLNLTDFVTDVLVLLRLSCAIEAPELRISCGDSMGIVGSNITNSSDAESIMDGTCEPHPWWFAIGAALLVCSMFLSALPSNSGFCITFFQLAPFIEIAETFDKGEDYLDDKTRLGIMSRDLKVKQAESAPQALMQSYMLWSLGTHTQPLNVFSVLISVSSLALSLALVLPERAKLSHKLTSLPETGDAESSQVVIGLANPTDSHELSDHPDGGMKTVDGSGCSRTAPATCIPPMEELFIGKAVLAAYVASDLGLRCVGYALLLSPSVRLAGIPTAIAFVLGHAFSRCVTCAKDLTKRLEQQRGLRPSQAPPDPVQDCCDCCFQALFLPSFCLSVPLVVFVETIVPISLATRGADYPLPFGWIQALGLCLRFLEYGIFAGLIMGLGQTACGERLVWESDAFLCLLGFNILLCVLYYGILRPCCRPALAHFEGRCENWAMALLGQLSSCRKALTSSAWRCGMALLELLSSCREALTSCRCCRKQVDTE